MPIKWNDIGASNSAVCLFVGISFFDNFLPVICCLQYCQLKLKVQFFFSFSHKPNWKMMWCFEWTIMYIKRKKKKEWLKQKKKIGQNGNFLSICRQKKKKD